MTDKKKLVKCYYLRVFAPPRLAPRLKQVSLKMRSRRSGMRHVLPCETRWPQIKKGDFNGLFLTSICILYLGCHLYPSSPTMNYTTSNDAVHSIINQASNSMASLHGEPISDHNVWSNSLVNYFDSVLSVLASFRYGADFLLRKTVRSDNNSIRKL